MKVSSGIIASNKPNLDVTKTLQLILNEKPPFDFVLGNSHPEDNQFGGVLEQSRIARGQRYSRQFTPSDRFVSDEEPLVFYHFNEGSGTILRDASGNGNDGKIIGAKWVPVDADSSEKP